jgi:hypothetical protein
LLRESYRVLTRERMIVCIFLRLMIKSNVCRNRSVCLMADTGASQLMRSDDYCDITLGNLDVVLKCRFPMLCSHNISINNCQQYDVTLSSSSVDKKRHPCRTKFQWMETSSLARVE